MAELVNNVVPVIVLDDDDESEISVGGSASEFVGLNKKKDDASRSFEAEKKIPKCGETVDGKSEERKYIVGDLVWCKLKNDPWMPAQVYDPKDASDLCLNLREKEGMLYVVCFGNGTCAWCLPEQLSPFVDNFVQNSGVCNSKISNSVQKAVDEFQRIVESSMVCKCVPESQKRGLARPVLKVFGVKEGGVLVPEVDINRIPVPKFEPYDVLADVRHVAKTLSVGNKLHLATLKSSLSAFYRSKGYPLALYHKPRKIRTKKIKTLDEIMGGNAKVESKGEGSESVVKKTRKRKVEPLESREQKKGIVRQKTVQTGTVKPDEIEVALGEDISIETKPELDNVLTPREKKKSRYLSHPYTSPDDGIQNAETPFPLPDNEMPVEELLAKIQLAAVKPLCSSSKDTTGKVSAFVSAVKSSTYAKGSNFKSYRKSLTGQKQKKKKRKSLPSQPKLSTAVTKTSNMETSFIDGVISDVEDVVGKLGVMTDILEEHQTTFSVEEKASLKEGIEQIKKSVQNLGEKVNTASEKVRIAEKISP